MVKKLLIFGAIGAALYIVFKATRQNFNIIGLKLQGQPALVVEVFNPSPIPLQINSIIGDLYFKGSRLAVLNDFTGLTVGPNQKQSFNFAIQPDILGLATFAAYVAKHGGQSFAKPTVTIKGTASTNLGTWPINMNFSA